MDKFVSLRSAALVLALTMISWAAMANPAVSTIAVGGYDVVSYFQEDGPQRGSGYHALQHEGATYIFRNEANLKAFKKDPEKYLPQYGGYCAYGVSVGKKFNIDPLVWEIVDGKLYLNLDKDIQKKWSKDKAGAIRKADKNWPGIQDKSAEEL